MANTVTKVSQIDGRVQFQSLFEKFWKVEASWDDQDQVPIGATRGTQIFNVDGVQLGDVVLASSIDIITDDGADSMVPYWYCRDGAVGLMMVGDGDGAFDADTMNGATVKLLIGRPSW